MIKVHRNIHETIDQLLRNFTSLNGILHARKITLVYSLSLYMFWIEMSCGKGHLGLMVGTPKIDWIHKGAKLVDGYLANCYRTAILPRSIPSSSLDIYQIVQQK